MSMDWNKIGLLLHIEEKTRGHGAALKSIHDAAWNELVQHNEYIGDPSPVPPVEDPPKTLRRELS